MRYLSVCSGIEAASVAWPDWEAVAFAEIEPFPCALLAHHYPGVPNWGDMTKFQEWPDADIDVLVGGTPCQSFSVAGLRAGLDDPRGNLMLTFAAVARRYRPDWVVWENVPGVLSSNGGKDFGAFLWLMGECGYHGAFRILDAQYFGVPQRRRRVFFVGHSRDWRRAAAVLFERESLRGNPPPSRETGKGIAPTISARTKGGGGLGTDFDCDGGLIHADVTTIDAKNNVDRGDSQHIDRLVAVPRLAETPMGTDWKGPGHNQDHNFVAHSLRADGFDASEDGTGRGTPLVPVAFAQNQLGEVRVGDVFNTINQNSNAGGRNTPLVACGRGGEVAATLQAGAGGNGNAGNGSEAIVAVAFDPTQITSPWNYSSPQPGDPCHPIAAKARPPAIAFSCKDSGLDAGALSPTLRSMGHDGSHANAGGQVAVAIPIISDADREESGALTPSPDADGRIRLRDPGLGIGEDGDPMFTMQATKPHAVAFDARQSDVIQYGDKTGPLDTDGGTMGILEPKAFTVSKNANGFAWESDVHPTIQAHPSSDTSDRQVGVRSGMQVRRLTPRECERLQGFPDDYTLIPAKHAKMAADGPRYKALGNSMAVPCMVWIGQRIQEAHGA